MPAIKSAVHRLRQKFRQELRSAIARTVGSVDEIALGAAHMRDSGWQMGWGLGRHVIGSNYFYYTRDPWGSFAEYYHDLDYIPEECAWVPRDFPEEDSLYVWGPPLPQEFVENSELG